MDNNIIFRFKQGDPCAADELAMALENDLSMMVRRYAPKQAEWQDMINTGYEVIFEAAWSFDAHRGIDFRDYACMKLRNRFINLRRKLNRESAHLAYSLNGINVDGEGEEMISRGPPGSLSFEDSSIDRIMLLSAIDMLPANDGELIYMYFYDNMTFAEIADVLGKSVSSVKKKIYRGIKNLKNSMNSD